MTNNQIQYANLLEQRRHNTASETTEARKAGAQESQARTAAYSAAEQGRHNLQQESVNWFNAQTEQQYKLSSVDVSKAQQKETARANRAKERENVRSAKVQESETERHNRASELAQYINAGAQVVRGLTSAGQLAASLLL